MIEPFKTQREECDYWERQFKMCESLRRPYEEIWYLNMAFYFSKQWVAWQKSPTGTSNRLVDPPTPRNRVRLTSNRIKPVIRDELTKLIKEEPQFYVVPNTTEPTDVAAAKVGESIAEYILKTGQYNKVRRQATFYTLLCGTGFTKVTCPDRDAELLLERITAFHMFVPNLEDEFLQTQPFVIHGRGMNPELIEEKYDVKVEPDMSVTGGTLESKFFSAIGIKNKESQESKAVYVKEIWIKPQSRYPKGGLLVFAGNKMVYRYSPGGTKVDLATGQQAPGDNEFPYDHGLYPFAKQDHTASGRFYGTSTIEDLIPLQKELNKTRSQVIEAKNRMAKPQMTYVKGSIDVSKITSEVGLYIPVAPGFNPPQPIVVPPLSNVFQEVDQRILQDMDEIAGRSDINRGLVPKGVQAAAAISYINEQNDIKIYNSVASVEEATEDIGRQCLELVQQFWSKEKIIKIVSKNNAFEASIYMMSDLKGNTDLRVESGSMAPKSAAANQAFITDLMDKGIIPPEKGLRYLKMNETNRLYDELQVDSKQAQRENFRMSQGDQSVVPNDFDVDQVHIYEHELYMKSQEFEMSEQPIKDIFINHLTATKQKVLQYAAGTGQPNSNSAIPSNGAPTNGQQPIPAGVGG